MHKHQTGHQDLHLTKTLQRAIETALLETGHNMDAANEWATQLWHNAALNITALASGKASSLRLKAYPPPEQEDQTYWWDDAAFYSTVAQHIHQATLQEEPWLLPDVALAAISAAAQATQVTDTETKAWARSVSRETAQEVSELAAELATQLRMSAHPPPDIIQQEDKYYEDDAHYHEIVQQEMYRLLTTKR